MASNEKNEIVMAGPFPPPVHGLSTTNAEVHKNLVALGADVSVLNTSRAGWCRWRDTGMRATGFIYIHPSPALGQRLREAPVARVADRAV